MEVDGKLIQEKIKLKKGIEQIKLKNGVQYKETLLSREYTIEQPDLLKLLGIKGKFGNIEINFDYKKGELGIVTDEIVNEDYTWKQE